MGKNGLKNGGYTKKLKFECLKQKTIQIICHVSFFGGKTSLQMKCVVATFHKPI